MTTGAHTYVKYTLATVFFTMCFMLTPRAWVDGRDVSGETVPVHMLDGPGEGCLWCAPLVPVDCAREEADTAPDLDRLQLHPDEVPVDPSELPCVDPEDAAEEEGPSA